MVWSALVGAGAGFPVGACAAGLAVALGDSAIPLGPNAPSALGDMAADVGELLAALCRTVAAVGLVAGDAQPAHMATAATMTAAVPSIAEPV